MAWQKISKYFRSSNLVPLGVLFVALGLAWNTVVAMQRNYRLEQQYKQLASEVELLELENQNMKYQIEYTKSDDFKELAARSKLGRAFHGESLVYINGKKEVAKKVVSQPDKKEVVEDSANWRSNLQSWWQFFVR